MQLEQALAKIEHNVQRHKELVERISRSPRAIKTIQALEAAIAIFGQNKQEPEYQISEYATGNRRWKRAPAIHLVPITDLLDYDVRNHHNKNRILGEKVANKVKAINNSKIESKIKPEGWQDKVREVQTLKDSILKFPSHQHLTVTCTISLFTFNFIVLDHLDHHFTYPFRKFTLEDLKDCEKHFSLQSKALHWAKTEQTHPAIFESTRLHGNPETRPNLLTKDLHRNTLVSVTLPLAGRLRTSESNPQFCLNFYSYTYVCLGNPINLNFKCCLYLGNSAKAYLTNIP